MKLRLPAIAPMKLVLDIELPNQQEMGMSETNQPFKREKMTLVLGGTGKTGRRVAARLRDLKVPVQIGSRSAEPPFDWRIRVVGRLCWTVQIPLVVISGTPRFVGRAVAALVGPPSRETLEHLEQVRPFRSSANRIRARFARQLP
jgi:hypothetical protein